MKTIIRMASLLTILSLLVILSGCVEIPEPPTPMQTETPTSTPTPLTPTELSLRIGETAKLPGVEATVMSAYKTDRISYRSRGNNHTDVAGEGKVLIVANFEIKNTGNKGIKFGSTPFDLSDDAGFSHSTRLYVGEDSFEMFNDLYPNQTKRGRDVFEVPVEAKGLKFKLDLYSFTTPDFAPLPIKVKSVSWSLE